MSVQTSVRLGCPTCKSDEGLVSYETIEAGYSVAISRENGRVVPHYTGEATNYIDSSDSYAGDLHCNGCDSPVVEDDLVEVNA
jgi:hypothetical protein